MKVISTLSLIAVMSTPALALEARDASLNVSSKASESVINVSDRATMGTIKAAESVADVLNALISRHFASSIEASGKIGEAIVKVSAFSRPVIKLTGDGLAMVFEVSQNSGAQTLKASEKLVLLLDPTLKVSGEALSAILEQLTKGSELSSEVSDKILEIFARPLELTGQTLEKLFEFLTKGSELSTDVSDKVLGRENVRKGGQLLGEGISLTSQGTIAALYFVSKSVTGISHIFDANREEIEKAVERNDQDTLAGLRELIRQEIRNEVQGGDVLEKLLSDQDLDMYINARLMIDAE